MRLPEPLADPLLDFRIKAATATAYLVKAGDYIQIIDVAGRQCTDFQCFSARKLDQGLDAAARCDGDPHADSAAAIRRRACRPNSSTSRFRAAGRGGAGHLRPARRLRDSPATPAITTTWAIPAMSTARRISTARWRPMASPPRKGWEAINYFYNTNIDSNNQLYLDEPWSRPGDYVLMRALTDLVCVSSACPDDIDAGQWLEPDRHPCPHLFRQREILTSGGLQHDPRRRSQADPRNRLPPALRRAHPQLRRVSRLLAAVALQQ